MEALVNKLRTYGVQFSIQGGKPSIKLPWKSPKEIPGNVITLLEQLKSAKTDELLKAISTWDEVRADLAWMEVYNKVRAAYPLGCYEWVEKHRPDIKKYLDQVLAEIENNYRENMDAFLEAVNKWGRYHFAMFKIYRETIIN